MVPLAKKVPLTRAAKPMTSYGDTTPAAGLESLPNDVASALALAAAPVALSAAMVVLASFRMKAWRALMSRDCGEGVGRRGGFGRGCTGGGPRIWWWLVSQGAEDVDAEGQEWGG